MQKYLILCLSLFLLTGCTGAASASLPPPAQSAELAAVDNTIDYQLSPLTATRQFCAEDNRELAHYSYQLLTLSVSNMEHLTAEAERSTENFNAKMNALLEELVSYGTDMGRDALDLYSDQGYLSAEYYDETSASWSLTGSILSVRLDSVSYTGGAHPNSYTSSCLFDLETGQFLDASQIAENQSAFRSGAAEKLIEKAANLGDDYAAWYWDDYQDIIRGWNAGSVLFDEDGMTVIYSSYELGPYAMGQVELHLDWDELSDLMGPGGMARLGMAGEK